MLWVVGGGLQTVARTAPRGVLGMEGGAAQVGGLRARAGLSVTRGGESDFTAAHPSTAELVIEVGVSSPALDRENASLYAEAGVKEYWIVLGAERCVEVYRRAGQGRYREMLMAAADETLTITSLPEVRVRVSDLFA
jgi:hypothetical protein